MESGVWFLFVEFEGDTKYLKMTPERSNEKQIDAEGEFSNFFFKFQTFFFFK